MRKELSYILGRAFSVVFSHIAKNTKVAFVTRADDVWSYQV
jgi:ribosome-associated toxin RatA of RatAB toxin-antitoxin module